MELKTIVAIGLVLFIVAGLVFLYMRNRERQKRRPLLHNPQLYIKECNENEKREV